MNLSSHVAAPEVLRTADRESAVIIIWKETWKLPLAEPLPEPDALQMLSLSLHPLPGRAWQEEAAAQASCFLDCMFTYHDHK